MILVVGSTGILGGEICRQLAEAGKPVRGLVRATSAPEKVERLRALGVETVEGDLRDPASLARACQGVEAVITTATTTLSAQPGDSIPATDRDGQLNLVQAAREAGVQKFVFVSIPLSMPPCPLTDAKRAVEQAVIASGMDYTVLAAGTFYEIWVSPMLGFDYVNGKANILGVGQASGRFLSLGDVARYAVASLDNPQASNGVFEIAAPQELSWLEIVRIFEQAGAPSFELQFVPEAALEAQRDAASDPLQLSFAVMMLKAARGTTMDTTRAEQAFGLRLETMDEYARRALGAVQAANAAPAAAPAD